MTKTPNFNGLPKDNAALGDATAALNAVQKGRATAAALEPSDPGRISDAVVKRLDRAATPPVGINANDPAV